MDKEIRKIVAIHCYRLFNLSVDHSTLSKDSPIYQLMAMQPVNAASTYYVSLNGSDDNPGTKAQPFRNIQQAVNQIKDSGGGTIYVRGGTYTLKEGLWIGNEHDGSADSRLVLRPYENEKVILESDKNTIAVSVGGEYVDIVGFEVRNSSQGIISAGARHIRVLNNIVHDTDSSGIAMYGKELGGTSDILIDGNTVYHTNLNNKERDPNRTSWGNGIFISRGKNAVITNNRVYENYGEGIISSLSDNVRAANNTVYDNYSVEMYLDHATNTTFENNLIYSTGNPEFFRKINGNWQASSGIQMDNEGYIDSNPNNDNIVRNNIVIGGRYGLAVVNQIKDTQIVNNSFYGATERLILFWKTAQQENVTIANNIFYQSEEVPIGYAIEGLKGVNASNNLWFGGEAGDFAGVDDLNADPKFVNPGSFKAEDYRLQPDSPAIDEGRVTNVSKDYFGTARSATEGYDIGAYEFRETTVVKPIEPQPAKPQPTEPQLVEPQPIKSKPVEPQPIEPQPIEVTPRQPVPSPEIPSDQVSNTPLVANPDYISSRTGTPIKITVLANDQASGDFRIKLNGQPTHGSAEVKDNGTPNNSGDDFILYKPDREFSGTDRFSYELTRGDERVATTINVSVAPAEAPPLKRSPQMLSKLIDLRQVDADNDGQIDEQASITFKDISSEAAYNNSVGFYSVENEQGAVRDPVSGRLVQPGDEGYKAVAMKQLVSEINLQRNTGTLITQLETGTLLAPFIVANGTIEQVAGKGAKSLSQEPEVYFAFGAANSDKAQHVKVLGNNQFVFEDLKGGGDKDFNDFVFRVDLNNA